MTDQEIERLCQEATEGLWTAVKCAPPVGDTTVDIQSEDADGFVCVAEVGDWDNDAAQADAKFIAASRTLVPGLLKRAQGAEAENAAMREAVEETCWHASEGSNSLVCLLCDASILDGATQEERNGGHNEGCIAAWRRAAG